MTKSNFEKSKYEQQLGLEPKPRLNSSSQPIAKTHVSESFNLTILDTWKFAEWVAERYVRLHEVWVHKYSDQRNKDNWKDTGELWKLWWENIAANGSRLGEVGELYPQKPIRSTNVQ